jgi:hypothetical protein
MKKICLTLSVFFILNHLFGFESPIIVLDHEQSQISEKKLLRKCKKDCKNKFGKKCKNKYREKCITECYPIANKVIDLKFDDEKKIELNDMVSFNKIKIGDFYKIKVSGINQINYKVLISQKDTLVNDTLRLPMFSDFNIDAISSALAIVDLSKAKVNPGIYAKISKNKETKQKQDAENTKQKKFSEDLTVARVVLGEIDSEIVNKNKELDEQVVKIENYFWDIKKAFVQSKIDKVEVDVIYKLGSAKVILDAINNLYKEFDIKAKTDDYLTIEEELRDSLLAVNVEVLDDKPKEQHLINLKAFGELLKAKEKVFSNLVTFQSNIKKSKEAISGDNWQKTLTDLSLIQNLQSRTYESLPIQYLGERSKTTITISPRDPAFKLNSYSTTFVFPLEKVPYFGVSSSFYISGPNFSSDVYSVKPITDSINTYQIEKEKDSGMEIGTAILAKFGRKITQKVGYHGSIGLGISFTDQVRPRLMAGGGFTFGSKNSLALDLGLIGGQVDRLSSAYDLNASSGPIPESVTVTKLKGSIFLSLGYFFRF